jgi:transposase-like protein
MPSLVYFFASFLALRGSGALAEGDSNCGRELNRQLFTFGKKHTALSAARRHFPRKRRSGNTRNGYSTKSVIGEDRAIEIVLPRDRNRTFEPQILANRARGF